MNKYTIGDFKRVFNISIYLYSKADRCAPNRKFAEEIYATVCQTPNT